MIHDLIVGQGLNQSSLARRIGVSQQTISAWLAGSVEAPTIATIKAVYEISGDSLLRLISVAYGWSLEDIGQRAVLDAVLVDEALTPKWRAHLVNQYDALVTASRAGEPESNNV